MADGAVAGAGGSHRPIRLLLVEDDDYDCAALARTIGDTGIDVVFRAVTSAEDAEQYRRGGYLPDLLIVDNGLPGIQGGAFADRVAATWTTEAGMAPLIVRYTGNPETDGDNVIRKPPSAAVVERILLAARISVSLTAAWMLACPQ